MGWSGSVASVVALGLLAWVVMAPAGPSASSPTAAPAGGLDGEPRAGPGPWRAETGPLAEGTPAAVQWTGGAFRLLTGEAAAAVLPTPVSPTADACVTSDEVDDVPLPTSLPGLPTWPANPSYPAPVTSAAAPPTIPPQPNTPRNLPTPTCSGLGINAGIPDSLTVGGVFQANAWDGVTVTGLHYDNGAANEMTCLWKMGSIQAGSRLVKGQVSCTVTATGTPGPVGTAANWWRVRGSQDREIHGVVYHAVYGT